MRIEAKHCFLGSAIHTNSPKGHDGEGKDFPPTDFLASPLGTCVITILGIEAKRIGSQLENIPIDVYKIMTKDGLRKIKNLTLGIYISAMDYEKYKILQRTVQDCSVKRKLENSIEIKLN